MSNYIAHLSRSEERRHETACGEPWQSWQELSGSSDEPDQAQGHLIRQCRACLLVAIKEDQRPRTELEFKRWPKIHRLNREIVITEKIDGTNAAVAINEDGTVYAQSRTRIITPDNDNHGFATWVRDHVDELREQLGRGHHFGEWWGGSIQGRYKERIPDKRFSLFNTLRWTGCSDDNYRCMEAPLCYVVPTIGRSESFSSKPINDALEFLTDNGSVAAPGCTAEGIVVYHTRARVAFKITLEKDSTGKGYDG